MRTPTSTTIYQNLKDEIIYLKRKPGEELSIVKLSEELSVSRSPIRDAILSLQSEGLVDMLPQRGCWVSRIDLEKVEEERFLRLSLEKNVIVPFINKAKLSDLAKLDYAVALQEEAKNANDGVAFYKSDDLMHSIIFEVAGYSRLWDLMIRESGNHRRMRLLSFDTRDISEKNIQQHQAIVSALKAKDAEKAIEIEIEHLSKINTEKTQIVESHSDYFVLR